MIAKKVTGDGRSYDLTAYKQNSKGRYQKKIETNSNSVTELDVMFSDMEYWFWGWKNENMPLLVGDDVEGTDRNFNKIIYYFVGTSFIYL